MTELAECHYSLDGLTRSVCNRLQWIREIAATRGDLALTLFAMGVVLAVPHTLSAQKKGDRVRVLAGSAMRTAPGGQVVGVSSRTFEAPVELVEGSAVRLRINGFVNEQSVRLDATKVRGTVSGIGRAGGTLRIGPNENEPALATLQNGAVVFSAQKSAKFLAVNRTVWVDKSRLAKLTGPIAAESKPVASTRGARSSEATLAPTAQKAMPEIAPGPVAGQGVPTPKPQRLSPAAAVPPLQIVESSAIRLAPNGDIVASLPGGTTVIPLHAENGWTRVRLEGWVPTGNLTDAGANEAGQLTAADVRADPAGTKGRVVRWTVEALSYQLGDALRRELNGEPYLLARGPGKERAILYLAIPEALVGDARALAPLTTIVVTARVRSGRSEPGGVPILDLLELVRK